MSLPDEELVRSTADLARLELEAEETTELARDFATILGAFQSLQEVDLPPTTAGASLATGGPDRLSDVLREDRLQPGLPREDVLAQAPQAIDGFFSVPRVIGEAADGAGSEDQP